MELFGVIRKVDRLVSYIESSGKILISGTAYKVKQVIKNDVNSNNDFVYTVVTDTQPEQVINFVANEENKTIRITSNGSQIDIEQIGY